MKFDYLITLQRPSYKAINIISQLLIFIYLITYIQYNIVHGWPLATSWTSYIIPLVIIVLWIINKLQAGRKDSIVYYRLPLLFAALGWITDPLHFWWLGLVYAVVGFCERFIKFPNEIGFTKEQVIINSFPKKTFSWVDVENVMIRDNLFTLDLRNNKMIQKQLDEPIEADLEQEFNQFCKEQLHFRL
jgi:hypothetical protein